MRAEQIFRDQRGVALPMAMMVLVLLTTLMLAFAVLSQTEPVIAHNQMEAAQARAHAEAGLERAVWALSQGVFPPPSGSGVDGSLASPLPDPVPDPYKGNVFVSNGTSGGYRVSVTSPDLVNRPNDRVITSIGFWTPTDHTDPRAAHRRIQATVNYFPPFGFNTPCALCVRGDLAIGGSSVISGQAPQADASCGGMKKGAVAAGDVAFEGSAKTLGDGNGVANEAGSDYQENQTDSSAFSGITLTASNFKVLRELAKQNGTYFGPGYPNGTAASSPAWTGTVGFSSSNKLKNGIVFIDTVSGNDIPTTVADQNPADFANVTINGNPFVSGDFSGWIVVNGSLQISGNMKVNGLVYAVNDFVYNGTGTGEIQGLAISQNIRDVTATAISSSDALTDGNSRITFNCANLKHPKAYVGYALVPGSYRELSD
jgi:cytoskeletal protein CcmA (bactofilin family)